MLIDVRTLANRTIQVVNDNITLTWDRSTGYNTAASGQRTETFASQDIQAQVQGLSAAELQHIDGLNVQGVMRAVYMYGNIQGVVKADQKGGDILHFAEIQGGTIRRWRVIQVLETWQTWCKVAVILQSD
jgi:hypothetical protein